MLNTDYYSKSLKYQKTASDSAFDLLESMQESSTRILEITLDRCAWLPEFGKEGCIYWSKSCKQTTSNVRSLFDRGYLQAEKLFSSYGVMEETVEEQNVSEDIEATSAQESTISSLKDEKVAAPVEKKKKTGRSTKAAIARKNTTKKQTTEAAQESSAKKSVSTVAAAPEKTDDVKIEKVSSSSTDMVVGDEQSAIQNSLTSQVMETEIRKNDPVQDQ